MRRVSTRFVKPGMVVGRTICDRNGNVIFNVGDKIPHSGPMKLSINQIHEVLIEDWRVTDVPVKPLFPPYLVSEATQAMRQLLTESQGCEKIDEMLLKQVETPLHEMVGTLFPETIGDVNMSGYSSTEEFRYYRPVKVTELCLLLGKRAGYKYGELLELGLAAMLKDIGYVLLPPNVDLLDSALNYQNKSDVDRHPYYAVSVLGETSRYNKMVIEAIKQHHERWDGSGYPRGIKGDEINRSARIIAVADAYFELVSDCQGRRSIPPHSAVEFIMASSSELFDPTLVNVFSKQLPLYPTGVSVKLNTGEAGIICECNSGQIGKPVVRVCYDKNQKPLFKPYEVDLSAQQHRDKLIVQVIDY